MKFALVADTFPPLRTSGAVQLRDLVREFNNLGHEVLVILPNSTVNAPYLVEEFDGFSVVRIGIPLYKNPSYFMRAVSEFYMPFAMFGRFSRSPLNSLIFDGIIWYSPSIFHGLFVNYLKRKNNCKGYLIIRDIFPQWAVDMKLIRKGILFHLFNFFASYQYSVADVIGVQSSGNLDFFKEWRDAKSGRVLEVLNNWLGSSTKFTSTIQLKYTCLFGRKVFVYTGNMGAAQGAHIFIELANLHRDNLDVGFLFVGRGTEVSSMKELSKKYLLNNVLFFDEIHPDELSDLYSQCVAGLVSLDRRHKTHNIPGKFISYLQNGLPTLACVNLGNDLVKLIRDENIGYVSESNHLSELYSHSLKFLSNYDKNNMQSKCISLFNREFSAHKAAKQIINAFYDGGVYDSNR